MSVFLLSPYSRKLLEVASLLHDIGISISYYEHHRHSFYIILNSRLAGFTHRETLLAETRYEKILLPGDIELWKKLSVFLKLAECLDRSEMSVIKALECQIIRTIREGDAELEISLANEHSNTFRKVFGKFLVVT